MRAASIVHAAMFCALAGCSAPRPHHAIDEPLEDPCLPPAMDRVSLIGAAELASALSDALASGHAPALAVAQKGCDLSIEALACRSEVLLEHTTLGATAEQVASNARSFRRDHPFAGEHPANVPLTISRLLVRRLELPHGYPLGDDGLVGDDCTRATHVVESASIGTFEVIGGGRTIDVSPVDVPVEITLRAVLHDPPPACPAGMVLSGDRCRRRLSCPAGQSQVHDGCLPDRVCPAGTVLRDAICVASPIRCPPGVRPSAGRCLGPDRGGDAPTTAVDRADVSVADYLKCTAAGVCPQPNVALACNWLYTERAREPVRCVAREGAVAYCRWRGAGPAQIGESGFRCRLAPSACPQGTTWDAAVSRCVAPAGCDAGFAPSGAQCVANGMLLVRPRGDIDAFYVDERPVSVAAYRACADAGACTGDLHTHGAITTADGFARSWACNWTQPARVSQPVNCASFEHATAFCRHANKRVLRDAEWLSADLHRGGFPEWVREPVAIREGRHRSDASPRDRNAGFRCARDAEAERHGDGTAPTCASPSRWDGGRCTVPQCQLGSPASAACVAPKASPTATGRDRSDLLCNQALPAVSAQRKQAMICVGENFYVLEDLAFAPTEHWVLRDDAAFERAAKSARDASPLWPYRTPAEDHDDAGKLAWGDGLFVSYDGRRVIARVQGGRQLVSRALPGPTKRELSRSCRGAATLPVPHLQAAWGDQARGALVVHLRVGGRGVSDHCGDGYYFLRY